MMGTFLNLIFMRMTGYQAHQVDKRWDILVNKILDNGQHISTDGTKAIYLLEGNEYRIWMANGLFALGGSLMVRGEHVEYEDQKLPSIRTTLRIYKEVYLREIKRIETEREKVAERLFS